MSIPKLYISERSGIILLPVGGVGAVGAVVRVARRLGETRDKLQISRFLHSHLIIFVIK